MLLLMLMLCQLFYWNASVLTPPKRQSKANPRLESIGEVSGIRETRLSILAPRYFDGPKIFEVEALPIPDL